MHDVKTVGELKKQLEQFEDDTHLQVLYNTKATQNMDGLTPKLKQSHENKELTLTVHNSKDFGVVGKAAVFYVLDK